MNEYIPELGFAWIGNGHEVRWAYDAEHIIDRDVWFFLSYEKKVDKNNLLKHKNNPVVHGSDLPNGRRWSPLTWEFLRAKGLSLFLCLNLENQ